MSYTWEKDQEVSEDLVEEVLDSIRFRAGVLNYKKVANNIQCPVHIVSFIMKELAYDGAIIKKGTWYSGR